MFGTVYTHVFIGGKRIPVLIYDSKRGIHYLPGHLIWQGNELLNLIFGYQLHSDMQYIPPDSNSLIAIAMCLFT